MKYFLIETDDKNRIPYGINKNRAIDVRLLSREKLNTFPLWNVVEMNFPEEGFFPDIICSPFILLSEDCIKTVMMYQKDIICKGIKLWDRESGENATYFLTILDELECISDKTQYNSMGNRILKLVLDQEKIRDNAVFKVKGFASNSFVGRLDFIESILRRDVRGIRLTEIDVCSNAKR